MRKKKKNAYENSMKKKKPNFFLSRSILNYDYFFFLRGIFNIFSRNYFAYDCAAALGRRRIS